MSGEQILYNRPTFPAQLNMSHPLTKGLVGCWLLNENGGMRAWDSSPYGNHGVLSGFAQPPKRGFNGLQFDGTDDNIEAPSWFGDINFKLQPFTLFFGIETQANTGFQFFGAKPSSDANFGIFARWETPDKQFGLGFLQTDGFPTGRVVVEATPIFNSGRYSVAITYDGSGTPDTATVRIEINGVIQPLATAVSSPAWQTNNNTIRVGGFGATFLPCVIYGAYVYNRVLSANETKSLYLGPYQMFLRRSR